jgi:uncharacterized protein YbbC (DUF1343 family)
LDLDGVIFRPLSYKPYYSKWAKKSLGGVQVHITNPNKVNLMSIQFLFLQEHYKLYPDKDIIGLSKSRHNMFDKVCGSSETRNLFFKNYQYEDIQNLMYKDVESFRKKTSKYYLY